MLCPAARGVRELVPGSIAPRALPSLLLPGGRGAAGSVLTRVGSGGTKARQEATSPRAPGASSSPPAAVLPAPAWPAAQAAATRTAGLPLPPLQEGHCWGRSTNTRSSFPFFFFFLVDWPLPPACPCPPTPLPFSLCSQSYKQESQCSCRSCPSRKSVEKRLGAAVLRGARLMTGPPGSSSQSMLSKLASARSRAMPPDGS